MLSAAQIHDLGFASVGREVRISDRCSVYGASAVHLGDHVRIDDYVVITARAPVIIGSYVHIAAFAFLSGQFGIVIGDFCNVSPRATLLSGNDDFSGESLPGALIPENLRRVQSGTVQLGRHAMVGAHSIVLPGVHVHEGAVVGALSLVKESLPPWGIYAGIPVRRLRSRKRHPEEMAKRLRAGHPPDTEMPEPT